MKKYPNNFRRNVVNGGVRYTIALPRQVLKPFHHMVPETSFSYLLYRQTAGNHLPLLPETVMLSGTISLHIFILYRRMLVHIPRMLNAVDSAVFFSHF
ncbi:hypothetical protein SAMN04488128_105361 [Chitinophaga eiseniae]|uniref:Uncharacterized protein n=1 Tax=Chitinophaga eiseniae TaxID=634771 RepID=A0A1T4TL02_9BACT|nr:hypothetical protein SAMN04488128_105361 [Chitinophaga eiseniae]